MQAHPNQEDQDCHPRSPRSPTSATFGAPIYRDNEEHDCFNEKKSVTIDLPATPIVSREEPSQATVTATVVFYLVAALVMVVANKAVLNATKVPLFFLWCQLSIAVGLLWICSLFGLLKIPPLTRKVIDGCTQLIVINVLGLSFNTYCLQLVDASFYQVARGLVLPFTTLLSRYVLHAPPNSIQVLASIGIVCFGFSFGVTSEIFTVSPLGIFMGVLSSLTTAVNAITLKRTLNTIQCSALEMVWYSNLLSAIVLAPMVVLMGELPVLWDLVVKGLSGVDLAGEGMRSVAEKLEGRDALRTFLIGAMVTGVFGFLISIAGTLSIKVTSPVTHMVSSAVRGVFQTYLGILLFGDIISTGRLGGIVFILGGSIYYTYLKSRPETPKTPYISFTAPPKDEEQVDVRSQATSPLLGSGSLSPETADSKWK